MQILRPAKDHLLLVQRPHYVLLVVGLAAVALGVAMLITRAEGWVVPLAGGALWIGFSSGYGLMQFDRTKGLVTAQKTWWGRTRRTVFPFTDIRFGEASRVQGGNAYFRLVMRGGGTFSLTSSANLINNAQQVADAVNEFLGLYAPGMPPVAVPQGTVADRMAGDPALAKLLTEHHDEALHSDMIKDVLAAGGHVATVEEVRALKAAGKMSRLTLQSTPTGAAVAFEGKRAGTTPLIFALQRTGDTPRVVTFELDSYNTVTRHVLPDGKDINLNVTLEPLG